MKKLIIAVAMSAALTACDSKEEHIRKNQIKVCESDFEKGREVTPWCAERVPKLRQYLPVPQPQSMPAPQYIEQAPVQYAQPQSSAQPVIVQAPAPTQQSNGMTDMLVGGLIGHAIGSAGNNSAPPAPAPSYSDDYYRTRDRGRPRVITQNITIKEAPKPVTTPVPAPASAPKKNYMDTSKLNSYGARPSVPSRSSGMNTSRFGSAGKR